MRLALQHIPPLLHLALIVLSSNASRWILIRISVRWLLVFNDWVSPCDFYPLIALTRLYLLLWLSDAQWLSRIGLSLIAEFILREFVYWSELALLSSAFSRRILKFTNLCSIIYFFIFKGVWPNLVLSFDLINRQIGSTCVRHRISTKRNLRADFTQRLS